MKNFVYIVVMGAVFFLGSIYLEPEEKPQPNHSAIEQYIGREDISEMYEELMNEESKAQFDKMHAQLEEYEQKSEERHNRLMLMVYVCAAIAAMPTLYLFWQLILGKLDLKTAIDVLRVFGISIGLGIVLFVINVTGVYLMFYAERDVKNIALTILLFGGGAALWIASVRTKKKEQEMPETKNDEKTENL